MSFRFPAILSIPLSFPFLCPPSASSFLFPVLCSSLIYSLQAPIFNFILQRSARSMFQHHVASLFFFWTSSSVSSSRSSSSLLSCLIHFILLIWTPFSNIMAWYSLAKSKSGFYPPYSTCDILFFVACRTPLSHHESTICGILQKNLHCFTQD